MNSPNMFLSKHTADILKAAFPYVNTNTQSSMNMIIKAAELADSVDEVQKQPVLSSCDINDEPLDAEALLTNVRPVCYPQEMEFVDMILNFIRARKIYHNYQDYASKQVSAAQVHNNNKSRNNSFNPMNLFGMNNNVNMMDFLLSQLTPEQRATFDNMSSMMSMMQPGEQQSGKENSKGAHRHDTKQSTRK